MTSPTGRRTGLNPAIAAPYGAAPLVGMDFATLERQFNALYAAMVERGLHISDTLHPGTYRLAGTNGLYTLRTASGNARQRRRQVREWRRQGFTVTHHWSKE